MECCAVIFIDVLVLLFHEPEVKEAMDKAIQNPTEDTIFQLSSITEANAFKAGVRECLKMFRELLCKE